MIGSEKGAEFCRRERGLSQDRAQRAGCELSVQRDDDRATVAADLYVAASLADLLVTILVRATTTAAPLTTGSAGLTQRAGRWR